MAGYGETIPCGLCGGVARLVRGVIPITLLGRTVEVEDAHYACESCGEGLYLPEMMDAVMIRATTKIRAQGGLLASDEIQAIRERRQLTEIEMEQMLGVRSGDVARWERGTVPQDARADRRLRLMA